MLVYFAEGYSLICKSKVAVLFYEYIFEAKLFMRYAADSILNELMLESIDILLNLESCTDFLNTYCKYVTNDATLAKLTLRVLTSVEYMLTYRQTNTCIDVQCVKLLNCYTLNAQLAF